MKNLFGTDGVRGVANEELTAELALKLGCAAGNLLCRRTRKVIIGRDTRLSGPMLTASLAAGFTSVGIDVKLAEIIPTPAISFLIQDERADCGAIISASHNPPQDNGIKFFDDQGHKITVAAEEEITRCIDSHFHRSAKGIGGIITLEAASSRYAAFLMGTIQRIDLAGMKIIVDCAHGATGKIAPHVLQHFNAKIIELNTSLTGERINVECGVNSLASLRKAVFDHRADLGIAFDGDGDRVMLVSAAGNVIDGDQMMGIITLYMKRNNSLTIPVVVATIMSNLGLERTLRKAGITLVRTAVGDRNVSQEMIARHAQVGGERSGHIIFHDHSATGDGILTAIQLLKIAHTTGTALSDLAAEIETMPQKSLEIPLKKGSSYRESPAIEKFIAQEREKLGSAGRIVVRPSGTQPLIRVMVEGENESQINTIANRIGDYITAHLS
ncbi:phosphoglucosamine mutase [Candidatus Acetothermia bacterium]|nr:phosphoglucosamine mutase [Candidatus Acetothermia bacterium]